LRDLKLEIFSLRLEAEEKRPTRDLNIPSFSTTPETAETVALIALKSESRCVELDAEPTEMLKKRVRPLKNDVTKLNELVRLLKNEFFSARPEAVPTDAVNPRIRPLIIEPPTVSDPVKDLNQPICSEKLVEGLSDPTKCSVRPLACEPARPRLLVNDLSTDCRNVTADEAASKPLRDLK
jgi:hypothetical protein